MEVEGLVQETRNPRWLRIVPTGPSEFSNALVESGELAAGDRVTITITKVTTTKEQ